MDAFAIVLGMLVVGVGLVWLTDLLGFTTWIWQRRRRLFDQSLHAKGLERLDVTWGLTLSGALPRSVFRAFGVCFLAFGGVLIYLGAAGVFG